MPYEEQSPFGAAIGMAGGWLQGQQQVKQQALQEQLLRQQIAQEAARQQLEQQEFGHKVSEDTTQDRINQGLNPQTGQPYVDNVPPPPKNATDAQMADWARKASYAAQQAHDSAGANYYKGLADSYDTGAYREATAAYNQAGVGLRQAQTKNIEGLFQQQITLAKIHASAQEYAAGLRAARAGAKARGNPSDTAYASALRSIGSEEVRAATEAAVIQYTQGMQNYRSSFNAQGQPTQDQPTLQMPNITIQMQTMPNGEKVPVPIIINTQQPKGSSSSSSKPSSSQPTNTMHSGGFSLPGMIHGIQQFFTGGGSSEPQRVINGKTYYQHSDGKWYTSP